MKDTAIIDLYWKRSERAITETASNTRNGLFQALKDGTEEDWFAWLQDPDNGALG